MIRDKIKYSIEKFGSIVNGKLFKNILLVGGIGLFIKVIAFYKETLIAAEMGLSQLLDTFFLALIIPNFLKQVFIGSLKNLFIPNYIVELKKGKEVGSFQTITFLMVLGLIVVLAMISTIIIKFYLTYLFPGHSETYYELIRKQFYMVLPCLFFWGMINFLAGLIEVNNKFFVTSLAAVFPVLTTIISVLFFKDVLGDQVLSAGLLFGAFFSFCFILIFSIKYRIVDFGKPKWSENSILMAKQFPPKVSSGLLTGLNSFVDQFFAAQLVIGSVAALNYGAKIPAFTVSIIVLALGSVLLPHFSEQVTENRLQAFKQLFGTLRLLFISMAIMAVGLVYFSEDIISILFERKEFTSKDTFVVANIQKIALIYVPFYICTLITVKFLTAINKNAFMAWASLWNLILNIGLNYVFIKLYGIYGLMLSTTCVYVLNCFIYVGFTYKEYRAYLKKNDL